MYRLLFRLVLSRLDPERAHALAFLVIRALGWPLVGAVARRFTASRAGTGVEALGMRFTSPFGVAAGFDKDARGVRGLGNLGFSHVEVGTVTALAQPGNDRPRLFRLIPDHALINRMGFNNHGATKAARRLRAVRDRGTRPVIGVNIGKSRIVSVDDAIPDYLRSARAVTGVADYLVVNVSSPNTPGLRGLQEIDKLEPLLRAVRETATVPLLVKIAPDLADEQVERIVALAARLQLDGIIATNTTISRTGLTTDPRTVEAAGAGGLSGPPVAARSLEVLRLIKTHAPQMCVISVGGVVDAADVAERLNAGASLVQGYTAFLYAGPLWARAINRSLRRRPDGTWSSVRTEARSPEA